LLLTKEKYNENFKNIKITFWRAHNGMNTSFWWFCKLKIVVSLVEDAEISLCPLTAKQKKLRTE
jgi:hypothetical protein